MLVLARILQPEDRRRPNHPDDRYTSLKKLLSRVNVLSVVHNLRRILSSGI